MAPFHPDAPRAGVRRLDTVVQALLHGAFHASFGALGRTARARYYGCDRCARRFNGTGFLAATLGLLPG